MIARLLTALVLIAAIGSVSWAIRAEAQDACGPTNCNSAEYERDELLQRVAELEQEVSILSDDYDQLAAGALPPAAPRQTNNEVFGFFTLEPGYTFEISCSIETYPMGTQYRLKCMRSQP